MSESNQYNEQNINNHQLIGTSPNFRTDLAKKLEELAPEAIADGKVDAHGRGPAEDFELPSNEIFGAPHPGKNYWRAFQIPHETLECIRIILVRTQGRRSPSATRNVGEW